MEALITECDTTMLLPYSKPFLFLAFHRMKRPPSYEEFLVHSPETDILELLSDSVFLDVVEFHFDFSWHRLEYFSSCKLMDSRMYEILVGNSFFQ